MVLSKGVRLVVAGVLLRSAVAIGSQARRARPQAAYNCCGDAQCDVVHRTEACPPPVQCAAQLVCCLSACNST